MQDRSVRSRTSRKATESGAREIKTEISPDCAEPGSAESFSSQEPTKQEDAEEDSEASASVQFPRARSAAWGLRDVYLCNNGGGGEGRRGRQEREGRKLEASSINGLPFCSPGRSIRLLFLSFFGNSFRRRNDPVSWFQGPWK
jgi:hypothetical protein